MADHGYGEPGGDASQRLTNDDFRKLLQTPRAGGNNSSSSFRTPSLGSVRGDNSHKKHGFANRDDKKSKKVVHARVKSEEEEIMAELAKKYRDRAKERRDGSTDSAPDALSTLGAYRAVAPDMKTTMDAAERRKQMIEESKFLGGDMEHTHLVKGLDYALLKKVRSELENQELEKEEEMEEVADVPIKQEEKPSRKDGDDDIQFKTIIGKNVYRAVFKSAPPQCNELFLPGRMAYHIELEDEAAEADIPTTVLRSKADCPAVDTQATLSTNDIVINKLTQILSYLRHGGKQTKKIKKAKENKEVVEQPKSILKKPAGEDSIYGNIGDYQASESRYANKSRQRDRDRKEDKRGYFDEKKEKKERDRYRDYDKEKSDVMAEAERTLGALLKPGAAKKQEESSALMNKLSSQPEGYAECYPGFDEMHDAIEDSDEDVDYTKMDLGSKKGLVGRWDFDTAEEYGEYMNKKEALPKAAFQYGLKMADGRKTRRLGAKTEKTEKAELDREWQKIQSIITKRKGGATDGAPEKQARRQ